MRLLGITFALLLGAAANARADVFVPADPPPRQAVCVAAAGDVVVATRFVRADVREISVSAGGGPWRHLVTARLTVCPSAAASADGTVAVAVGGRLWVRRGGRFAAPVQLGYGVSALTVAPGGWAAAVGSRLGRDVLATVVRPDRGAQTTRLARSSRDTYLIDPRIGIDAGGTATIAWTRQPPDGDPTISAARLAAGRVTPLREVANAGSADVAVAPGGRTLLAWAQDDGVTVSIDGGPAEHVGPVTPADDPSAEITDDGSALIAYATADGVLTADRAAGGAWLSHRLWTTPPARDEAGDSVVALDITSLTAALAPDGRAAVAWAGVRAAAGRAGGDWGQAVRQSAVTRNAEDPSLTLAATGEPRLVWVEDAGNTPLRLRGARLSADAVTDTVAPVLTTALPSHTPRTKTARVTFRIPVTCSEACDASVRLTDGTDFVLAESGRELAGGRRTTLTLRVKGFVAVQMLAYRRLRHPRLEVLVTDRAGNVALQRATVAFRIVDRPLLDYRVGPNHDFAMFSKAGDRAVGGLVNSLITSLARGTIKSERELRRRFVQGRAAIRRQHDEIDDTEVGDAIFLALYVPCVRRGYDPEAVVSG